MDFNACAQCGVEIEGKGIQFRGRTFCGDECCEEFEAEFGDVAEPNPDELNDDFTDEDLDDDLGYRGDDEEDDFDDDYVIDADGF